MLISMNTGAYYEYLKLKVKKFLELLEKKLTKQKRLEIQKQTKKYIKTKLINFILKQEKYYIKK